MKGRGKNGECEMIAWKSGALALLLAAVAVPVSAQPAFADVYKTSCYKANCVRLECDEQGADCYRLGYFERDAYDLAYPHCYYENHGVASGGDGPGATGCGSGPSPQYHYLDHFDSDDDYAEY
jgi:hypothetical protein